MKRASKLVPRYLRVFLLSLALLLMLQPFLSLTNAVTSGPSQPEFKTWTPTDRDDLVDPFTGDFQYSIPLFELPGPNGNFPFTLTHRSGAGLEQEASWVGLGWSLCPGAITRQVRGIPDDFNGSNGSDRIAAVYDMLPSWTLGVGGKANLEVFGGDTSEGTPLSAGVNIYYNNYRGFGWSGSLGYSAGIQSEEGLLRGGVMLEVTFDSQQGTSLHIQPSFSINDLFHAQGRIDVNSINDLNSLSLNTEFQTSERITAPHARGDVNPVWVPSDRSTSFFNFNFGYSGYASPGQIPNPGYDSTGVNVQGSFKTGAELAGIFVNPSINGFYMRQSIDGRGETKARKPFGYLHLHEANKNGLLDFYREKDGPLWNASPNLSNPVLTNDLYNVSGSTFAGTFRAFRNDIPILYDPLQTNDLLGFSAGFDLGAGGLLHGGLDLGYTDSHSETSIWDHKNELLSNDENLRNLPERLVERGLELTYFQFLGEPVDRASVFFPSPQESRPGFTDYKPIRVRINEDDGIIKKRPIASSVLDSETTGPVALEEFFGTIKEGIPRNPRIATIQAFTNEEILKGPTSLLGILGSIITNREFRAKHPSHIAAFVITDGTGMRYVYGIPVYNLRHEEYHFSTTRNGSVCRASVGLDDDGNIRYKFPGTDEYFHKKTISPYVHSYLLTSVLGSDYADIDVVPGPSDGDFGHWVKFNYQGPEIYKWRAPYFGARSVPGYEKPDDDKASFTYGEREVLYLSSAETKTHVAYFDLSERKDNRGASTVFQNSGISETSAVSKRLDKIRLYSKDNCANRDCNVPPLKTVHFSYNYELAPGVPNYCETNNCPDPNTSGGKLTLKELAITYLESTQGLTSPYIFEYGENPVYEEFTQDWWDDFTGPGNIKCDPQYPYTDQSLSVSDHNRYASAWNLSRITEPGGGSIIIEYEKDRYAYVQDQPALRFYKIASVNGDFDISGNIDDSMKVYVDIEDGLSKADFDKKYLDGLDQVYFKVRVNLNKHDDPNNYMAYVSGYAAIADYGVEHKPGGDYGYIQLVPVGDDYHPFSVAGWEHLRLQEPDKISHNIISLNEDASDLEKLLQVLTMIPRIPYELGLLGIFTGVYSTWHGAGRASIVDLDRSWIRLRVSEDGKFGGGARVKRVTINDNWHEDTASSEPNCESGEQGCYGFIYEYKQKDGSCSGVATYEPLIGGEENPVRTAKRYTERYWFKTDHNLYFENPVNEAYFPPPSVGYSRVRRYTFAADKVLSETPDNQNAPSVRGPIDYEFYTARDNPVQVDETNMARESHFFPVPIPFIGMLTAQTRGASQGYSIILNNMHGKPKRTTQYEISEELEIMEDAPIRSIEYVYQDGPIDTIHDDISPANRVMRQLGRKDEFFLDLRQHWSESTTYGFNPNIDVILIGIFPFPLPTPWVAYSEAFNETKTVVTNRVIYNSFHLVETRIHERGKLLRDRNLVFERTTGRSILKSSDNSFGNPVFNLSVPASWTYGGMEQSYRRIGLYFEGIIEKLTDRIFKLFDSDTHNINFFGVRRELSAGDEYIVYCPALSCDQKSIYAILKKSVADGYLFFTPYSDTTFEGNGDNTEASFLLFRSAQRNILGETVYEITALDNPIEDSIGLTCKKTKRVPCKHAVQLQSPLFELLGADGLVEVASAVLTQQKRTFQKDIDMSRESLIRKKIRVDLTESGFEIKHRDRKLDISFLDKKGRSLNPKHIHNVWMNQARGLRIPKALAEFAKSKKLIPIILQLYPEGKKATGFMQASQPIARTDDYLPALETFWCYVEQRREPYRVVDRVLDTNAKTFKGHWIPYYIENEHLALDTIDAQGREFLLNSKIIGNWRPEATYIYIDDRKRSDPVELAEDGIYLGKDFGNGIEHRVVVFSEKAVSQESCVAKLGKWRLSDKITEYSPHGDSLEAKDTLNIYFAALFGHHHTVPIATASNARINEIGFEGFEEYAPNKTKQPNTYSSGNISFHPIQAPVIREKLPKLEESSYYRYETIPVRIVGPFMQFLEPQGKDNMSSSRGYSVDTLAGIASGKFKIRDFIPLDLSDPKSIKEATTTLASGLLGFDEKNQTLVFGNQPFLQFVEDTVFINFGRKIERPSNTNISDVPSECLGHIVVEMPRWKFPLLKTSAKITEKKAHTGNVSFKIYEPVDYEQLQLSLEKNKEYVFSVWVSRDDTDISDYSGISVTIGFITFPETQFIFEPTGTVIEGWQRIEGKFTTPAEYKGFWIRLSNRGKSERSGKPAYFDDLRIYPYNASFASFAYNRVDLKLRATLNEANFATFFDYDEKGDLYLVRKETLHGIVSVEEGRYNLTQTLRLNGNND